MNPVRKLFVTLGSVLLALVLSSFPLVSATLRNSCWDLSFDDNTGAIGRIATRPSAAEGWTVLFEKTGNGQGACVTVYDVATGRTFRPADREISLQEIVARDSLARLTQWLELDGQKVSLALAFEATGRELAWKAVLVGSDSRRDRALRVALEIPLARGTRLWYQNLPEWVEVGSGLAETSAWYVRAPEGVDRFDNQYPRHDLTLPLVVLVDPDKTVGVSVAFPVDGRLPSAGFLTTAEPGGDGCLQVVEALVGLRGTDSLTVSGWLVAHPACYRPGLEWMLGRWPDYFLPDEGIYELAANYSIGSPATGRQGAQGQSGYEGLLEYGATFFEMHAHFPWYGLYFPVSPDTDVWPDLLQIEHGRAREEALSVKLIDQRLGILAKAGFHTFYYFAINDGYPPQVERRWPDAIAAWPDRVALSGWRGGGIEYREMNADTSFTFGRDLVRQADGIVERIGPLAGIFFDTIHHNDLDFAHDDGLTLVYDRDRPKRAYSINFCYDFFLEHLARRLHHRRQFLFSNGPAAIRNARGVDAVMLEGEGGREWEYEFEYRRFLVCLARPLVWLFPGRPHQRREVLLQRCLLYGGRPSAPSSAYADFDGSWSADVDRELWLPYLPLYTRLSGRRLCFEPDPLDVPTGCRGELFTLPDGRYALALIDESLSVFDPANRREAKVSLRLKKPVSQAMVFTPLDHAGSPLELSHDPAGGVGIELKDFRGTALVLIGE